ncbi:hypothetical protein CPB83DRAFT_804569 [Crepidotus variabilis]|uniref:HAT C-terminal dimerisation domain-containing protein n=1 Tax=Crepidotus variabilis TaxID=179855 RepID=A0A9P6JWG1_9AGAR|nr:hypothetical protein CPB83DRAFT_804569 [Crepidotus variabilis]
MDVLPAQASAVPCERVFSSSKETGTIRQNRIGATLFEALQVLKFAFKYDWLDFVDDLLAKPEDYTISGPLTQNAIEELKHNEDEDEVFDLIHNSTMID